MLGRNMSDESKDKPEAPEQTPEPAKDVATEAQAAAPPASADTPKVSEVSSDKPVETETPTLNPLVKEAPEVKDAKDANASAEAAPAETKAEAPAATSDAAKAETPPKAPVAAKPVPPKAPVAAGAHKPAPPPKKGPTVTEEIKDDPFINRLKEQFGDRLTETVATYGQQIVRVKKDAYLELCRYLRNDAEVAFDMCVDLTATHWPERTGEEFDIVVFLYSVAGNRRLRVKTAIAEGESAPSVTPIWAGADWMEREVFDMFGIGFDGHPDLRRILLPEDWPGHPLRKEYPIEYRDNEWTDKHLEYREVDYDTSLIDVKYGERR